MHQALYIDEIIRSIFNICADEERSALCQLARCCQAWKDPALDSLWRHLPSATPLLRLIPGVIEKGATFALECPVDAGRLTSFRSYALRVRSIAHRLKQPIDPIVSSLQVATTSESPHILTNLTKVHIGCLGWDESTTRMGISRHLRHLTLHLGFNTTRTDNRGRFNIAVAEEYLEQVARTTSLRHLCLRGSALGSVRITNALSSMRSLCVLSLTTGKSLTVNTLSAVATFPLLSELYIHAGHIDADEFANAITVHNIPLFQTLQKLHVRAHPALVELLLQIMSSNDLRDLNIEAEQPTQASSLWISVLNLIPLKASSTLLELRVEHHIDIDIDIDTSSNSNDTTTHSDSSIPNSQLSLVTIRPLAQLPHLRRFTLDTIVPLDFSNADIEEMAKWWPHIEHLDLGGLLSDADCLGRPWKLRTTFSCLETLAKGCPRLETLCISLDVTTSGDIINATAVQVPSLRQHPLRRLTVGSMTAPNPLHWSQYLRRMFPCLSQVDGISPHEGTWSSVQEMLRVAQLSSVYLDQMTLDRVKADSQDRKTLI